MKLVGYTRKTPSVVVGVLLALFIAYAYFSDSFSSSSEAPSKSIQFLEDNAGGIGGDVEEKSTESTQVMEKPATKAAAKTSKNLKMTKAEYLKLVKSSHDTSQDGAIQSFQEERLSHLKGFCDKTGPHGTWKTLSPVKRHNLLKHLLVSDKYKFLYCYTPKIACANWKKILKVLDEKAIHPNDGVLDHMRDVKFLSNYPEAEIEKRLRTYYKFTFVREPVSRLVSAFINKFREIKDFQLRFGVPIIKKYRANPPESTRGDDVTFDEFARSLFDSSPERYNEHWMSVENLCQPCVVNYDFFGAYENLEAEANFLIRQVNASKRVAFPSPQSYYKPASLDKVRAMFLSLPEDHRQQLVKLFENDFRMFNYPLPQS
ncbi:carbohydrate sulfotransferase 14-like [Sycon ciliatum]|uniref:carbohydrate sulfotransferase 14-like n=1 Tax=Sycon ciliatum TaxID=27933 RepID=UPI0020AAAFF7|eukprot:scpid69799/ scgid32484/ Carbohydrate sulfotransferase 14; Dermatan 4-sulfotransferase 1